MANALENHLLQTAQMLEDQVDAEINRLETMDDEDMESLRRRRLEAMKKSSKQKQEWLVQGHGQYSEVADEKEFFDTCKKSKNVVCHFYRESTFRCKIVDKHLAIIAPKHMETKFIKIDAERSKFLVERLRIKILPTLCIAKDGKTVDYIVGFADIGNTDDFPTEMLEWRLGCAHAITYQGDLVNPPSLEGTGKNNILKQAKAKKTIRQGGNDSSDDDW